MAGQDEASETAKLTWLDIYILVIVAVLIAAVLFVGLIVIDNKADGLKHILFGRSTILFVGFYAFGIFPLFGGVIQGKGWAASSNKRIFAAVYVTLTLLFFAYDEWDRIRIPVGAGIEAELAEVKDSDDLYSLVENYRPISNISGNLSLALLKSIDERLIDVSREALRVNGPIQTSVLAKLEQRNDWPRMSQMALRETKSGLEDVAADISTKKFIAKRINSSDKDLANFQSKVEKRNLSSEDKETIAWYGSENFAIQFDQPWLEMRSRLTKKLDRDVSDPDLRPLIIEGLEQRFRSEIVNALSLEERAVKSAIALIELLIEEHGNYRVEADDDIHFSRGGVLEKYAGLTGALNTAVYQLKTLRPRENRPNWLNGPHFYD